MNFKMLMATDTKIETFDTLSDAKAWLNVFIYDYKKKGKVLIGFIKQSLEKYVIYYDILESPQFIDDSIDYINQWQYEHDSYIECIMLPFFDNILTIEIDY